MADGNLAHAQIYLGFSPPPSSRKIQISFNLPKTCFRPSLVNTNNFWTPWKYFLDSACCCPLTVRREGAAGSM